ncbi:MAG: hypothetical protein ACNS64_05725, partial [Candidatus Halalkalibacterium sp. M3_1C_030]
AFRNQGVQGSILSPAYLLQLLFYQQLLTVDDYFADAFYDLESRLTSVNALNKMTAFTARSKNINELNYIHVQAPEDESTFEEEKLGIDLQTHQDRLLDDNNEPYLATYIEGQPQKALVFNQVKEKKYNREDFLLRFYTKIFDPGFNLIHRKEKTGKIHLAERGDVEHMQPSVNYFRLPNSSIEARQFFTAELQIAEDVDQDRKNNDIPNSVSAFGKIESKQPQPLNTDVSVLEMSDIIVGSNSMNFSNFAGAPAAFKVAHDKKIPVKKNLMIHFEVYHLKSDPNPAISNTFEIQYKVRPKNRNLFQRIFKGDDKIGLTLNFETDGPTYKTDLEAVTSSFEIGKYELELKVLEHSTGREISRSIEFEIVEES